MDEARQIELAAERLAEGRLVAFPTETVYGLGADALRPDAVRAVFQLKRRPPTNPLILHVSGPEMAARIVDGWTERADRLAATLWPGPLTLVLPASPRVPREATAGLDTVAVRCPNHPTALALIFRFGGPIVGPSANPSGRASPTRPEHVVDAFPGADLLVLDGGPCAGGIESTVLSLVHTPPRILRPGLLDPAEIEAVLHERVETPEAQKQGQNGTLQSPGMLPRHYAPGIPATLVDHTRWERTLADAPVPCAVLAFAPAEIPPPHTLIEMPTLPEDYARALYHALRLAEASGAERILIERPAAPGPLWDAIRDRLKRATT